MLAVNYREPRELAMAEQPPGATEREAEADLPHEIVFERLPPPGLPRVHSVHSDCRCIGPSSRGAGQSFPPTSTGVPYNQDCSGASVSKRGRVLGLPRFRRRLCSTSEQELPEGRISGSSAGRCGTNLTDTANRERQVCGAFVERVLLSRTDRSLASEIAALVQ
jgi:hypothetical protein